jgi:hypothetical protein
MSSKTKQLEKEIAQMQAVLDKETTPESVKEHLRPALEQAKKLLSEAKEKPQATVVKQKVKKAVEATKTMVKKAKAATTKRPGSAAQQKDLKALVQQNEALKEMYAGATEKELQADAARKALPPGERTSASGKKYREYRANRSDVGNKKPYLKTGGQMSKMNFELLADAEVKKIKSKINKKGMYENAGQKELRAFEDKVHQSDLSYSDQIDVIRYFENAMEREGFYAKGGNITNHKYHVTIEWQSKNGELRSNNYFISASSEQAAIGFAEKRVKGYRDFGKIVGGSAMNYAAGGDLGNIELTNWKQGKGVGGISVNGDIIGAWDYDEGADTYFATFFEQGIHGFSFDSKEEFVEKMKTRFADDKIKVKEVDPYDDWLYSAEDGNKYYKDRYGNYYVQYANGSWYGCSFKGEPEYPVKKEVVVVDDFADGGKTSGIDHKYKIGDHVKLTDGLEGKITDYEYSIVDGKNIPSYWVVWTNSEIKDDYPRNVWEESIVEVFADGGHVTPFLSATVSKYGFNKYSIEVHENGSRYEGDIMFIMGKLHGKEGVHFSKIDWHDGEPENTEAIDNMVLEKWDEIMRLNNDGEIQLAKGGKIKTDPRWHVMGLNRPPDNFTPEAVAAFEKALDLLEAEKPQQGQFNNYYDNAVAAMGKLVVTVQKLLALHNTNSGEATQAHQLLQEVGIYNYKTGLLLNTGFLNEELAARKLAKGGETETGYTLSVEFNPKNKADIINKIEKALKVSSSDTSMFSIEKNRVDIFGLTKKEENYLFSILEKDERITNLQSQEMMAKGGRTSRGIARDRKFKSQEPHEQRYQRKTSPKNPHYKKHAAGGATFNDKVTAITESLVGKPVPKIYQKKYGKRYTRKTAEQAAKRIAGAMVANE